jgi:hypothetical protein
MLKIDPEVIVPITLAVAVSLLLIAIVEFGVLYAS